MPFQIKAVILFTHYFFPPFFFPYVFPTHRNGAHISEKQVSMGKYRSLKLYLQNTLQRNWETAFALAHHLQNTFTSSCMIAFICTACDLDFVLINLFPVQKTCRHCHLDECSFKYVEQNKAKQNKAEQNRTDMSLQFIQDIKVHFSHMLLLASCCNHNG